MTLGPAGLARFMGHWHSAEFSPVAIAIHASFTQIHPRYYSQGIQPPCLRLFGLPLGTFYFPSSTLFQLDRKTEIPIIVTGDDDALLSKPGWRLGYRYRIREYRS